MQVLKSIQKNVPSPATNQKEETNVKVPSETLKLSEQMITFHHKEAGNKPGVSGLPDLEYQVPRRPHPGQAPFQISNVDRLHKEMASRNELMCQSWDTIRREAQDLLIMLIRFDAKIGMDGSRILCDAVNIINKAAAS